MIGHEDVRAILERELPPVTLLLGPKSTGKTTLARHLAAKHHPGRQPWYYDRLSAGLAREIVESAPVRYSWLDIRIIDLDNSTEASQNILLKVLEEPPPHCRFILVASRYPLATVVSRSRVFGTGLLTDEQVAQVLRQCGASEHEAEMAAARGRGQVAPALEAVADKEADRISSVVAAAVRAAAEGGGTAIELALRNWTPEHTVVLTRWATEAASGRWVIYTEDFAPGVSRGRALSVLYILGRYTGRTAPSVALNVLKEKR